MDQSQVYLRAVSSRTRSDIQAKDGDVLQRPRYRRKGTGKARGNEGIDKTLREGQDPSHSSTIYTSYERWSVSQDY